jgi:sugar/nucleoside kinase (ribokinase family)
MSVLVVGTLALDYIETPWDKTDDVLGGSATYISFAARLFTEPVGMVAVAGRDFPEAHKQLLISQGIDLSGLQERSDRDTFAWGGRYHDNVNVRDTLFTHLNALAEFDPVVPDAYRNSKIVCLGNLSPDIQTTTLNQLNARGFIACDTMNYWITNTPEALRDVLAQIDCLLINDEEAYQMTSEHNLILAARKILALGPRILVIKKGEHGAMLFIEEQIFTVPGFPLDNVRDPTGAGDSFLGAFAGSLACESHIGLDALKRAVIYGSSVASFCVETHGPFQLIETPLAAVEERTRLFRGLTEWPGSH